MRIAILYICTGIYNQFFDDFYKTCEKYFLSKYHHEYFVFTDDTTLGQADNVNLIYRECSGFPMDSLMRFEMFLTIEDQLKSFDYIYFFNSNSLFLSEVKDSEILPNSSGLVGAEWPGKRKPFKHPMFYPYERNSLSKAYIKPRIEPPYIYFMGGINGGTSKEYLKMIRTLAENIQNDLNIGIIAKVHDESHINAYFHEHQPKILTSEYCWPEEWKPSCSPKIIFRDKVRLNNYFNKGRSTSIRSKIKKTIDTILFGLSWYLN